LSTPSPSTIPLVFIDSNILYPIRLADLVLSSVDDGLFEVCVSEDLLNEIERVLIDTKGLAADKAQAFTRAVASNAAHVAPNSQYLKLAAELTGPDSADLLHLAAAIESCCDVVLTNNIRHFTKVTVPEGRRVPEILTPEQFFLRLIDEGLGSDLAETVLRICAKLKKPRRSTMQLLDGLAVCGLTKTADSLRNYFS
jgi:predicted nucleic acid-binding protein